MSATTVAQRRFNHTHSSGRFDEPISRQNKDLAAFSYYADLITLTEQGTNRAARLKGFKSSLPGWDWYYPTINSECAVLWDPKVFKLAAKPGNPTVTHKTWVRSPEYGGGTAALVRVFRVPLLHIPSDRLLDVMAVHMPLDNTQQRAEVWLDCTKGLREQVRIARKERPRTRILLTGDWNKNFREPREREQLRKHLALPLNLKQAWVNNVPAQGGTHGPRGLIDADLTNLIVRDCDLLKDTNASDHRPYRSILMFPTTP